MYIYILLVLAGGTTTPDQDGEGENPFHGSPIEVNYTCLTDDKFPPLAEEV